MKAWLNRRLISQKVALLGLLSLLLLALPMALYLREANTTTDTCLLYTSPSPRD